MIAVKALLVLPYFVQVMTGLQVVDVFYHCVECCLLLYLTDKVPWALSRTPDGEAYAWSILVQLQYYSIMFALSFHSVFRDSRE